MKKNNSIKYLFLFFDYLSALISWFVFYYFRKTQIEKIDFEFSERFYLGLFVIPILWVTGYWLFGSYDNVFRKYRMQVLSKTLLSSIIGTLLVFFIFILDDTITVYSDYYTSFIVLFALQFLLTFFFRFILTSFIVKSIHSKKIGFKTGVKLFYFRHWNEYYKKSKLLRIIQNIKPIEVLKITKDSTEELINEVKNDTSSIFWLGYASAFEQICNYLESINVLPLNRKVKGIIAISEGLNKSTS